MTDAPTETPRPPRASRAPVLAMIALALAAALAAYAELSGAGLRLRALVASPDGKRIARAECEGTASDPEALGARAAAELRRRGAAEILASIGQ